MRYLHRNNMDSPPSYSLSVTGPLSEIGSSGIGGSISSDSVRAHFATTELQESDMESKSLSQDSFDYSDGINSENFNTLKKGPWTDILSAAANKVAEQRKHEVVDVAIKPPPEFQDSPSPPDTSSSSLEPLTSDTRTVLDTTINVSCYIIEFAESLVETIVEEALATSCKILWPEGKITLKPYKHRPNTENLHTNCSRSNKNTMRFYASSDYLTSSSGALAGPGYNGAITITPFSTLNRPASRSSLASSRLSSSHNSLNTTGLSNKADDSSFITSAMSHDVLTGPQISDMYNVPFDSDIYTVPIDVVRPFHHDIAIIRTPQRPKRHKHHRKRRRNTSSSQSEFEFCSHLTRERHYCGDTTKIKLTHVKSQKILADTCCNDIGASVTVNGACCNTGKRHSVPGTSSAAVAAAAAHRHQQQQQQQQLHVHHTHQRQSKSQVRNTGEPIHMTLHEVRQYLQTLYSSGGSGDGCQTEPRLKRDKKIWCQQHPSIHLAHVPKMINLNNNNKYSNPHDTLSLNTNTVPSNKTGSNGLATVQQHNNNNINNCNNNYNSTTISKKHKKNTLSTLKYKKNKDEQRADDLKSVDGNDQSTGTVNREKMKKSQRNFSLNLKQTLCNIFRFKKIGSPEHQLTMKRNHISEVIVQDDDELVTDYDQHPTINGHHNGSSVNGEPDDAEMPPSVGSKLPFFKRALPPLPKNNGHANVSADLQAASTDASLVNVCSDSASHSPVNSIQGLGQDRQESDERVSNEDTSMDFAASIEKVKDYGWYWGPISGEAAEKILSNEPDGSFIVRDSSDDHYIFSLSFKLNNCVRHVRIEHDQGNFSFGSCTKFKSHTIVDFIENAVEHSRSGRYLFFLHRRPVLGPMRVQLLHPVSRFKQVQSLQHTCRFVILKMVRKDLIPTLPLPRRLIDYLSAPHYYSEQLACEQEERVESPVSSSTGELEKICFTPQGLS
uniref:Suppressor of cytokine signaling 7 n=1 Tax=Trichogramma kaykai TaxID=54128 RepID=A0ABD2WG99_9HYME